MLVKKLSLLFLFCCLSCMVWAKERVLVIAFYDGTEMTFALAKHPLLTFADQRLCISAEGRTSECELSDVKNFHFKEGSSDIRVPRSDDGFIVQWLSDDLLVICNVAPDAKVRLYGLDGRSYAGCVIAAPDRFEVSLSSLPKGIYLLNINNQRTLKINRK